MSALFPLVFSLAACIGSGALYDSAAGTPEPLLLVEPVSIAFGVVPPGTEASAVLSLGNRGGAPLTLSALNLSDPAFALDAVLPVTIDPERSVDVTVRFVSADEEIHWDTLEIQSNTSGDPATVHLVGYGAPPLPVARCSAELSTEGIEREVEWRGDASNGIDGLAIVDHVWTLLSAPEGSTVSMPAGGGNRTFTADLAGRYEARLVVVDEAGTSSEPCTARMDVPQVPELAIGITWTVARDDMDLHLVRGEGELGSDDDCYFENCRGQEGLDWGVPGESADDPLLQLDDTYDGPEYITLPSPEAGTFTACAHDYPNWGYDEDDTDVTMTIYLDGAVAWTDTRTLTGEDVYLPFADITFPGGTITPR